MVGGNVETSQRVVDVLLGAFDLAAASQGTMNNLTFGDGTLVTTKPSAAGPGRIHTSRCGCRDTPHDEHTAHRSGSDRTPVSRTTARIHDPSRIRRARVEHRGGDGIVRRIEFLRPVRVSFLTERRGRYAPYGLH